MPLSSTEADNFLFLKQFIQWLDTWKSISNGCNCLSKETHFAIHHTTKGLLEMATYCLQDLNYTYFLPGKVQTDALEARFGKYRQLAGSQYLISIRQIFEVEAKLRMQDFLPLKSKSSMFGNLELDFKNAELDIPDLDIHNSYLLFLDVIDSISAEDFINTEELLPVFTYVAGYCGGSALRKFKCEYCPSLYFWINLSMFRIVHYH
jgi:hypothetical protein